MYIKKIFENSSLTHRANLCCVSAGVLHASHNKMAFETCVKFHALVYVCRPNFPAQGPAQSPSTPSPSPHSSSFSANTTTTKMESRLDFGLFIVMCPFGFLSS